MITHLLLFSLCAPSVITLFAADAGPAEQPPVSPRTQELNRYDTRNNPDYTLVHCRHNYWPNKNGFLNSYTLFKKKETGEYRLEVRSEVRSVENTASLDLKKGKAVYRPWGIVRANLTIEEVAPGTEDSITIDEQTGIVISVLGSGLELIGPKCYVFSPQTSTGETTSRTQEVAAQPRLDVAEYIRRNILQNENRIRRVVETLWRNKKLYEQAKTK